LIGNSNFPVYIDADIAYIKVPVGCVPSVTGSCKNTVRYFLSGNGIQRINTFAWLTGNINVLVILLVIEELVV
jgi:hypothetical protein